MRHTEWRKVNSLSYIQWKKLFRPSDYFWLSKHWFFFFFNEELTHIRLKNYPRYILSSQNLLLAGLLKLSNMQTLWEIQFHIVFMSSQHCFILSLWKAEYSNANTTIIHLTTSAQVNWRLLKSNLSSKIKIVFFVFFSFFPPWLLLLKVWDWNTGLTFPISLPHYKSSVETLVGVSNRFIQHPGPHHPLRAKSPHIHCLRANSSAPASAVNQLVWKTSCQLPWAVQLSI